MNKIFENKEKKNNLKKNTPYPYLKARGEYEKDREIRIIEGLAGKKLSKDYIDKLTVLLYNSKNKENYSQKRNNIKKAIYKLDENNELYLTLPKINKNKKIGFNNNYAKTETTEYTNNKISSNPSPKELYDYDDILDENIKEILYDNEDMTNKNKKNEEEEKGKILFEQLKTRYEGFDFGENGKNNKPNNINDKKAKYKSLPKIKKKQIPSEYKLIATPQQISEFDYNLGKSFVNGNLRYLTKFQKEKLAYIAELNIFNSIDRLKEKNNMIKEIKYGNKNKKTFLMPIDFFKYNAEKWEKISFERNKNYNNIIINNLNKENIEKLNIMKDNINKLNLDAFIAEKEVNKTIDNINNFLGKYEIDRSYSRSSSRRSFMINNRRRKPNSDERKEANKLNN